MSNAAFSASAEVLDKGRFRVTVTETGLDTASMYVEEWTLGTDYDKPAASATTYSLGTVRVNGDALTAYVLGEPFVTPHLEIDLSPPENVPSLTLKVTNALWENQTIIIPLSADDLAGATKFLADANFPLG
jgi:hypothetical protein